MWYKTHLLFLHCLVNYLLYELCVHWEQLLPKVYKQEVEMKPMICQAACDLLQVNLYLPRLPHEGWHITMSQMTVTVASTASRTTLWGCHQGNHTHTGQSWVDYVVDALWEQTGLGNCTEPRLALVLACTLLFHGRVSSSRLPAGYAWKRQPTGLVVFIVDCTGVTGQ